MMLHAGKLIFRLYIYPAATISQSGGHQHRRDNDDLTLNPAGPPWISLEEMEHHTLSIRGMDRIVANLAYPEQI